MKAFISYSHRDINVMRRFKKHLKPLEEKFKLNVFSDKEIVPGDEWEKRIWEEFDSSDIIFILVSIDFLNSEFCLKKEFKKAIDKHRKGKAKVVPIICSHCDWKNIENLSDLQALPEEGEPIRGGKFKNQDMAFTNISNGINKVLSSLIQRQRNTRKIPRPPKPLIDNYQNTDFKAVFFDLDGTIIRGKVKHESFRYSWQLVWAYLGFADTERRKYHKQYLNKDITYDEWCKITRDLFRDNGLMKSHFNHIVKKVRLTKNCKETLRILKVRGVKNIIVSGGIDTFLEAVFPDYGDFFDYVFINKFNYENSGLLESIETTPYDFDGKYNAITDICKKHNFKINECAFVGEGPNDMYVVKKLSEAGGLTIGYPAERLGDYVDHELWKDRLDAILDILFKKIPIS